MLLHSRTSPLTERLAGEGAPLGGGFTFLTSLYFRGKLTYANAFAAPPQGWSGAMVIAPGRGLLGAEAPIRLADLQAMARVPVDPGLRRFREPLLRDARQLEIALGEDGRAVLLGSVATDKYVGPLCEVFGRRLLFPPTFVGRGDMSRGGLLLRCARTAPRLDPPPRRGGGR